MKRIFYLLVIAFIISADIAGQGVTQSADGSSTVVLNGSAISLDIAKADMTFGWNNLNSKVITKNNGLLIGGNIKVKNAEGTGALFSKGELVPESNGTFYLGGYFSNAMKDLSGKGVQARYAEELKKLRQKAEKLIKDTLDAELDDIAGDYISDAKKAGDAVKAVKSFYDGINSNEKLLFVSRFKTADADPDVARFRAAVKERFKIVQKNAEKEYRALSKERFMEDSQIKKGQKLYRRFTCFVFGGIDALDFKRFTGVDSSDLSNSFKDEYFRGGHFGIGMNFEIWRFRVGLTYAYKSSHNFSALQSAEYTLESTTTINNQSLQSKETVTAYAGGKYGRVEKNELNVDIIYNCRLDKDGENHILINPYLRGSVFSRDTSLLINKTNIGLGGYFFKKDGKFLGGIYLELPDVNNNAEKKKPVDKQNLRPPLRRLTFGIVAKMSLKSIFQW